MLNLSPTETERLVIAGAAAMARARRARGALLNQAEAEALLADEAFEAARDGLDIAAIREHVSSILTTNDVLAYVDTLIPMVCVEGQFRVGSRLITVFDPIRPGPSSVALDPDGRPGAVVCADGHIEINAGAAALTIDVINTGDRAIQITSHYHFFEVNRALSFDRATAYGKRLDIPAGTSARFEPGAALTVSLVDVGGARIMTGHNNLVNGPLDDPLIKAVAMDRLAVWLAGGAS